MKAIKLHLLIPFLAAVVLTSSCEAVPFEEPYPSPESGNTPATEETGNSNPTVSRYPLAERDFYVQVPNNTAADDTIYLSLLDEVTGLALNASMIPMTRDDSISDESNTIYKNSIPLIVGSTIKYRYARQSESILVSEHNPDGEPVRYRLLHVDGPGTVSDIVSRWTDTPYIEESGIVYGRVLSSENEQPLADLLISAGGIQTVTDSEGNFYIDRLPPGTHNLVVYAKDGQYDTFQQGALVESNSPTQAPIQLTTRPMVEGTFTVDVPENTPPIVPIRMAGNLEQLGNSFLTLNGGMSGIPEFMPVISPQPDGNYSVTLQLPVGAHISYKYTLGDGFWNAEHNNEGEFRIRQIIVPEENFSIKDEVETWQSTLDGKITFDTTVPANTPENDFVAIQFNPLFGWTEPIPMWSLGNNRWAYILYSPLNLPGNVSYRYCRNGLCGSADDIATMGEYGAGRPINLDDLSQNYQDNVEAWSDLGGN